MGRQLLGLVLGCICAFSSIAAQTVQFSTPQAIQTNAKSLSGLAVADFNGDGKLDIAVTDLNSQLVSVYLNDGKGNFGNPVTSTFSVPSIGGFGAIVAGDVNEDGKQDLIIGPVSGLQYDVVLLGNGDGTFTEKGQITGSYGFFDASLVDLNGDKHLDLVAGANGSLWLDTGDGQGDFTKAPLASPLGAQIYFGITVGDFNGDKKTDLLATSYNTNSLIFYPGNGDGSFGASSTIPFGFFPRSVTSADFNGDGKLDLLVGSVDVASVIFGNGDGTFQTGAAVPLPLTYINTASQVSPVVAAADMDGNGTIDAVVADNGTGHLNVLLNDGTGKFTQAKPDFDSYLADSVAVLKLADLNGDGLPDVVLIDNSYQKIWIFLSVIPKTTPMVSVQSSSAQAVVGAPVTITVQVKPSGSHTPTGTVTLSSGSTSFGQQSLNSSGQASFTLPSLAVGQYSLTASYSGDTYNNSASNSTVFTQSSTDFQVSIPSSTQAVAVGAAATYNLTLTPQAGFTGPVSFSCSGLPAEYTCSAQPVSVSGQPTNAMVVVSPPPTTSTRPDAPVLFRSGSATLLGFALCFYSRRRKISRLVLCLAALTAFSAALGCSSSPSKPAPYRGTSNFTITAATTQGGTTVSHQVSATLTVQ